VASPDILEALHKTHSARYLGEALSPTTVVVKPGGEEAVRSALAELGYLTSSQLDL
jgi:DNA polymerase II small subunit/DNA polymerase delta subunit B